MSRRDRIALVALGVVALGGAVFFVMTRDGEAGDPAPTQAVLPSQSAEAEAESEESSEANQEKRRPRPKPTGFIPSGRDPFVPLVEDVGIPAAGTTTAATAPTTETTSMDPTTDSEAASGTGDGSEREQSANETMMVGGHRVTLQDIFRRRSETVAQVRVDGSAYVVAQGEKLAKSFRLVSIQSRCADLLFGDQSFTLCDPGERK